MSTDNTQAAERLLRAITNDDCQMYHWPVRIVAEFLDGYVVKLERELAEALQHCDDNARAAFAEGKRADALQLELDALKDDAYKREHGHGRD